ncbi:hypothetical protein [Dactylosporangium sp. CA-092794]|uniref:hypothetical protein n=1 Tax=Dactylosporangium sp. CA-092794 TaxID=3239929 RepID=UPI003D906D8C
MTGPHPGSLTNLTVSLPPLTDRPVRLGHTSVGAHRVTVWADRPARGLTRIILADAAGRGCGDGTLHGDTLTLTLPGEWSAVDRAAATCLIGRLVHLDGADG